MSERSEFPYFPVSWLRRSQASSCFDADDGQRHTTINWLYLSLPSFATPSMALRTLGTSCSVARRYAAFERWGQLPVKEKSTRLRECFFLTGNYLSSQAASSQVLSAYVGLTAVFEMGTGGTPQLSSPDCLTEFAFACSLKTPHRKKIDILRSYFKIKPSAD